MSVTITTPGVRVAALPDIGVVTDASSVVAEKSGSGRFLATALRDYINLVTATGGTSPFSNADRWARIANVLDHGAVGNGTTDDTAAIQATINTGRPVFIPKGTYKVTQPLTFATPGQIIAGDGKGMSMLRIDTTFNMAALGVFVVTAVLPAPQFHDFEIDFTQPDTAVRGSLTTYPPAFYAQGMARGIYRGLKIVRATTGMDLRGNTGGTSIIDCEISAFANHVICDGSLDTCTIQNSRFEGDGLTANQQTIYATSGTVGLNLGRGDGLLVSNCSFQCGTQVFMFNSTPGGGDTLAAFSGCAFDGGTAFAVSSARLQVTNSYFSTRVASSILLTGGSMTVSGCHFYAGGAPLPAGQAFVGMSIPTGVQSDFVMTGCILECDSGDMTYAFAVATGTGLARMNLTGNTIKNLQGIVTATLIDIKAGANATLIGNRFVGLGVGGSGTGITIEADGYHNITGNTLLGLTLMLPVGYTQLVARDNDPGGPGSPLVVSNISSPLNVNLALQPTGTGFLQFNITPSASATAGVDGPVPGGVAGYIPVMVMGSSYKIPYFNN